MPDQRRTTHVLGLEGEACAESYLTKQGMVCIARRYRSPYGEIDLIMLEDETLVCVEVKYRRTATLLAAQLAVSPSKQRKITQTLLTFLNAHPEHAARLIRFDIVAISDDCVQHLPNAFQGSEW